ncbi:hypothetical protein NW765_009305 [Fusarium oxysporum]|nr:hypothetical protein NW765_009305 [Fusarium oxysporum]KAJ4276391.1 hypothetical protein NW764_009856 [Fusarium oxysporum]
MAMLDYIHQNLPQPPSDTNNYGLGSIGSINIAVACLPAGQIGSHPASAVATRMQATFPNLKVGLMVGIGGGVPSSENDIRLGDVVVSLPTKEFGGVVQHDMGKKTENGGWVRTGSLNGPPTIFKTTMSKLIARHQIHGTNIATHLSKMVERHPNLNPLFTRQASLEDILYKPEPEPEPQGQQKSKGWATIDRPPRLQHELVKIHYGLIASGNQVIKSGRERDLISERLGGVLCFEMEAAGLMNELPCVVIRGICDYADAHKTKEWQEYCAAVAAAYAKELVLALPRVAAEHEVEERKSSTSAILSSVSVAAQRLELDPGPHWLVPFSRNRRFTGREQELSTLREWFLSEYSGHHMAVSGLGGVGKTQIALEFAYQIKESNPQCSVFWVPATNPTAFEQAYLRIGQALKIPGVGGSGSNIKESVKDALSNDSSIGQWLMVVDNADDISTMFGKPAVGHIETPPLTDCIPFSLKGSVLFTTRNRKVAIRHAETNVILLEMMTAVDAKRLFINSLLRQEVLKDAAATERLLDLLGCLPLAIVQAAAYINENDTTIAEYSDLYTGSEAEVMEVLSEHFEDHGRYRTGGSSIKNSIATTWLISFSQIRRMSSLAIEYLSFMACLSNQGIPQTALPPAPTKKQSIEAIGALTAYSLVNKRSDGQTFDMHRLVHLATRNWLRKELVLETWATKAVSRMVELLPSGGHENRATWTAYLPHAKYLLSSIREAGDKVQTVVLAEKLGGCLYSNGRYSDAQEVLEEAVALRIQASGLEHSLTLDDMFFRAEALSHRGKFKEAEHQHREILELRRKVLGPKDPEVSRSLNYLAQAIYEDGRFVEAEEIHREALALQIEVLHDKHRYALTTTGYIAQTLGQQGRYEEAEPMHRSLLKTRLEVQGPSYPATLATMSCLGVAQRDLGHFADAEQTHRKVLASRIKILGDKHPHTLVTKRWLADALVHQGKYEEALSVNSEVLSQQIEELGIKHPNTILSLSNLGDIFFYQGHYGYAKELYQQVHDFQKEILGPEHHETIGGLNNLGRVYYKLGDRAASKECYERVLELRKQVLGPDHPKTVASALIVTERFSY